MKKDLDAIEKANVKLFESVEKQFHLYWKSQLKRQANKDDTFKALVDGGVFADLNDYFDWSDIMPLMEIFMTYFSEKFADVDDLYIDLTTTNSKGKAVAALDFLVDGVAVARGETELANAISWSTSNIDDVRAAKARVANAFDEAIEIMEKVYG